MCPVETTPRGEFALIERLARQAQRVRAPMGLFVDSGDDALAWYPTEGRPILATTDTMVQGIHFTRPEASLADVGWKAMASNISDIAAMGGIPCLALVTFGLPHAMTMAEVEEINEGAVACGEQYRTRIAGGDIVASPLGLLITVVILGEALVDEQGQPLLLRRAWARHGDLIAVTGALGAAGGWVYALQHGNALSPDIQTALHQVHYRPRPRVREAQILVETGVRAGIDVSDGLVADVGHIAEASGLTARIFTERVPVHPAVQKAYPNEALRLALSGGEDYELVVTAPPPIMESAIQRVREETGTTMTVIGDMVVSDRPSVVLVDAHGRESTMERGGFDHLLV